MRALAVSALLPLALSALAPPPGLEEVRLSLKYKAGEEIRYRIVQEMRQEISGPMEIETSTTTAQVLKQKVKSISPEGVATIQCTWEALKMHISNPAGEDVDYDSTRGDSAESLPEMIRGLASLVGASFEMETKPDGQVLSMHGIEEAMEKVFGGEGASSNPMKAMFKQMFTEDSMKRMVEAAVLPEKPLAVGAGWERDVEVPMGPLGKIKVHGEYELAGLEDVRGSRCARIGLKQEMSLAGGKPDFSSMPGGDQLDITLAIDESKGTGFLLYSLEPGRMVQYDLATHMSMSMKMKPKDEASEDTPEIEMTIGMDMDMKMLLLGADEPAFEPKAKDGK